MHPDANWVDVSKIVAASNEIDDWGLTKQRLNVLVALGRCGTISKARLCIPAACKEEELERFVMPPLLVETAEEEALVHVGSRGYFLTKSGYGELDLRNIPHPPMKEEE